MCLGTITYASEIWTLTKALERQLAAAQKKYGKGNDWGFVERSEDKLVGIEQNQGS